MATYTENLKKNIFNGISNIGSLLNKIRLTIVWILISLSSINSLIYNLLTWISSLWIINQIIAPFMQKAIEEVQSMFIIRHIVMPVISTIQSSIELLLTSPKITLLAKFALILIPIFFYISQTQIWKDLLETIDNWWKRFYSNKPILFVINPDYIRLLILPLIYASFLVSRILVTLLSTLNTLNIPLLYLSKLIFPITCVLTGVFILSYAIQSIYEVRFRNHLATGEQSPYQALASLKIFAKINEMSSFYVNMYIMGQALYHLLGFMTISPIVLIITLSALTILTIITCNRSVEDRYEKTFPKWFYSNNQKPSDINNNLARTNNQASESFLAPPATHIKQVNLIDQKDTPAWYQACKIC